MREPLLLLGHSPDPDDAFMFYALAANKIDTRGWRFEHVLQDIQTLNDRAARAELHITAVSIHAYPAIAGAYALLNCGASMGDGYGPMVVAREPMAWEQLRGCAIAVPGLTTTAYLALMLLLGRGAFQAKVVPFDEILAFVERGGADAGLIIHEGQLTYGNHNLHKIVDLGEWWLRTTNHPLPLGGNCIRRDLGIENMRDIASILRASIEYGLAHRSEAVQHALRFARDMDARLADRFVGMYVNDWTLDYGPRGRSAVDLLLSRAADLGMVPRLERIDWIG